MRTIWSSAAALAEEMHCDDRFRLVRDLSGE
jgi:hypothetical protein